MAFLSKLKVVLIMLSVMLPSYVNATTPPAQNEAIPKETLTISSGIFYQIYRKYSHYLTQDVCQSLQPDFNTEQIDKVLVDIMITCLAFKQQGVELDLVIEPFPNNMRAITLIEDGKIDALAPVIWNILTKNKDVYKSVEVIKKGQAEKGVFVHEDHPLLTLPSEQISLANYSGITMKKWIYDWQIIDELTPKNQELRYLPQLFTMLKTQRADFTLFMFPAKHTLSFEQEGITVKPLQGVKVVIPDSFHFIASKRSKNGKRYFDILNKGLIALHLQGKIDALYQQSGFYNPKVKEWKVLNRY